MAVGGGASAAWRSPGEGTAGVEADLLGYLEALWAEGGDI
jgi:hypothetical protein